MSYIPTIIIDMTDLIKVDNTTDKLKEWKEYDVSKHDGWAMNKIRKRFLQGKDFTFKNIDFIMIGTELSWEGKALKKALDKINVPYAVND